METWRKRLDVVPEEVAQAVPFVRQHIQIWVSKRNVQSMLFTRPPLRRWRRLTKSHITVPQVIAAKIWWALLSIGITLFAG